MLVAITFDTHHFSISDRTVTDEEDDSPPPAKKARIDPFADMRDGNPTNKHEPTNHSRASGREELARYNLRRCKSRPNTALHWNFGRRMAENFHCWLKLPGASSAFQPALPSRRETFQRSAVPLLTIVQGCRWKLLKQWNTFVGQCVVHCLTRMTNYLI